MTCGFATNVTNYNCRIIAAIIRILAESRPGNFTQGHKPEIGSH
jgi:hypothetical protein